MIPLGKNVRFILVLLAIFLLFLAGTKEKEKNLKIGESTMLNDIQITENFNLSEFESPDTKEIIIDPQLVMKLQTLRDLIGQPLIISSGYRTEEHNEDVGGVDGSLHRKGKAVDILLVNGMSIDKMAILAEKVGFDGIGKYHWGIHVDTRGKKARWDDRK